jgi:hypothetical protein
MEKQIWATVFTILQTVVVVAVGLIMLKVLHNSWHERRTVILVFLAVLLFYFHSLKVGLLIGNDEKE